MKQEGFGAAGTVRTAKTARENIEEKSGTVPKIQELAKEQNRGLDPLLSSLKLDQSLQIPWGKLYLVSDGEVLQAAWKDQNIVLFMTTVSTSIETILRTRRRPAKTATNARTSRHIFGHIFGDLPTKQLLIPRVIDDYNHHMGGVDQTDQLRSYFNTQSKHNKNWKPLWHFLLDSTVTNCLQIHRSNHHELANRFTQKEFRTKLAVDLFSYSERLTHYGVSSEPQKPLTNYIIHHHARAHHHRRLFYTTTRARLPCKLAGRRPATGGIIKRNALGELSVNTGRSNEGLVKRRIGQIRSHWGCQLCNMPICKQRSCWMEHIEAIQ